MEAKPAQYPAASLHWEEPIGNPRFLLLENPETIIGRGQDCDITLTNVHISRVHAKIIESNGEFSLIDIGSTHGTFVNGEPVQLHILEDGDRIQLGKMFVELEFRQPKMESGRRAPRSRIATPIQSELRNLAERRRALEREMRLAEETQEALLPQDLPIVPGFLMSAYSKPTRHVGGDFYDFLHVSGNLFGMLGDVSGKGVAASLMSSMVLGCVQTQLRIGRSLEDTIQLLNGLLLEKPTQRFVTLFVSRLDSAGRGEFISGGHNPAFVYRQESKTIEVVSSNNLIVGAFATASFKASSLELSEGDVLVVYSDGLTEAENHKGLMLGEDCVRDIIMRHAPNGASHLRIALLEIVHDFTKGRSQADDITFSIIERRTDRTGSFHSGELSPDEMNRVTETTLPKRP